MDLLHAQRPAHSRYHTGRTFCKPTSFKLQVVIDHADLMLEHSQSRMPNTLRSRSLTSSVINAARLLPESEGRTSVLSVSAGMAVCRLGPFWEGPKARTQQP